MFFNIGGGEILVIAMVALIAVGPEQLPGLLRKLGRSMAQLRAMTTGLRNEFMSGLDEVKDLADPDAWLGEGTDDDPVVPRGYNETAAASKRPSTPSATAVADDVDEDTDTGGDAEIAGEADTDGDRARPAGANGSAPSSSPPSPLGGSRDPADRPRINEIAQANSTAPRPQPAPDADAAAGDTPAAGGRIEGSGPPVEPSDDGGDGDRAADDPAPPSGSEAT